MNEIIDTSPLPSKRYKDYRGKRFHRLLIVAFDRYKKGSGTFWKCRCDCGNYTTAKVDDLKRGHTKSCGCYSAELLGDAQRTHGMSGFPEYKIWIDIKSRCYNPKATVYEYYGGRGVEMCQKWQESFEAFYEDMGPRPSPEHSIDRIDGSGDYEPDNCRWVTQVKQNNNRSINRMITYKGKTMSVADWSRHLDIPYDRLRARILRGMPIEKAFSAKYLDHRNNS